MLQLPYADKWDLIGIDCRYVRITITKSKTLFLFLHLAQIAEIEIHGCDIEENMPLITGESATLNTNREESERTIVEGSMNILQGIPTVPGKPAVRFE